MVAHLLVRRRVIGSAPLLQAKAVIAVTAQAIASERRLQFLRGRLIRCTSAQSYVERLNLTTRMQIRRFTRLTNAFSKKMENHEAAVTLHFMHYNFCRVHKTLRVTPAMEVGLAYHVWTVEELVATMPEPVAKKRGSYRKRLA